MNDEAVKEESQVLDDQDIIKTCILEVKWDWLKLWHVEYLDCKLACVNEAQVDDIIEVIVKGDDVTWCLYIK